MAWVRLACDFGRCARAALPRHSRYDLARLGHMSRPTNRARVRGRPGTTRNPPRGLRRRRIRRRHSTDANRRGVLDAAIAEGSRQADRGSGVVRWARGGVSGPGIGSQVESRPSLDPDAVDQHFGFADVLQSLVEARQAVEVFPVGDEQDSLLRTAALFHLLQRLIQRVLAGGRAGRPRRRSWRVRSDDDRAAQCGRRVRTGATQPADSAGRSGEGGVNPPADRGAKCPRTCRRHSPCRATAGSAAQWPPRCAADPPLGCRRCRRA
jgi:hypothetical protein